MKRTKTEEEWREQLRPQAELRLNTYLVLRKLAQQEGIDVAPEEIQAEIDSMLVESGEAMRASVTFSHWALKVVYPIGLAGEDRRSAILRALEGWYRHRAAARLAERVNHWAHAGGREPQRVLIRGQRRRWGSCSADGTLRFNWRIVQLEPSLIDYVVVHELAHLRHRNHSARFWAEVARVLPDYRLRRRLLKDAGPAIAL